MTPEQLEAIEGIGPKTVEKISLAVNNYFASLDAGAEGETPADGATAEVEAAPEPATETAEDVSAGEVEVSATEGATDSPADVGSSPAEQEEREPHGGSAPETVE